MYTYMHVCISMYIRMYEHTIIYWLIAMVTINFRNEMGTVTN